MIWQSTAQDMLTWRRHAEASSPNHVVYHETLGLPNDDDDKERH